ncbi:MAG TPA: hypothetical protein VNI52_06060 [Sphingobacteriaceae bacterium]|nr:hypothetical protein [Sphingobacteriaceae bacterium]
MGVFKTKVAALLEKIGMDGAIAYTVFARGIQALGGLATILVIAKSLSKDEQGYYYTFGSVLALQVFFELGLNSIITQYVAHEMAHLTWGNDHKMTGDQSYQSRLSSLLHFFAGWLAMVGLLFLVVLLAAGFYFFSTFNSHSSIADWKGPWIILAFTTAAFLLLDPMLAFLEGLGRVKEVARMRLVQQTAYITFVIIFLTNDFKLYSSALASFTGLLCTTLLFIFSDNLKIMRNIWKMKGEHKVSYRKEIFPYQWKIAASWISGYFIFQLFNPVLFASEGAVTAGQMGMTLAALNGIMGLSMSWINTKIPLFSMLISQKNYAGLDLSFFKSFRQSLFIMALGLVTLFLIVYVLRSFGFTMGERFLPTLPFVFISISYLLNTIAFGLAAYLRCHKAEPLLVQSLVFAVFTSISTITLGNYYGVFGITLGYLLLGILIGIPWVLIVFVTKRKLWHQQMHY